MRLHGRFLSWTSQCADLGAIAFVLPRRPESHKRMMPLASISIIQPAFARIFRWPVFDAPGIEGVAVAASFVIVGALIVYDLVSRKKLHPATMAGAAVFSGLKFGGVFLLAPFRLGPWLVRAMVAIVS
jgi:hypothetical protein